MGAIPGGEGVARELLDGGSIPIDRSAAEPGVGVEPRGQLRTARTLLPMSLLSSEA
jgi:hypothetical protein